MKFFKSNKIAPITIDSTNTPPPPPPPSPVLSSMPGPSRNSMADTSCCSYDSEEDIFICMCCKCTGDHCVANTAIICVSSLLLIVLL